MSHGPPAATPDASHLHDLVATLAEDTIFVLAGDLGAISSPPFDALAKRRADVYAAVLSGQPHASMLSTFDAWLVDLSRAMAPISPPDWLPMGQLVKANVTLEAGARGLRSLFSHKPGDKETARVTRLGTLAIRLLRQVLSAEGAANSDDARMMGAFVASLGLPPEETQKLLNEPVAPGLLLDVYGEIEPKLLRAILQGAWLAAATDGFHPREEQVIRDFASKAGLSLVEVEEARNAAMEKVEERRLIGLACIDYVRAVLQDRLPGIGETIPVRLALLLLPRRYRDEGMAPIGHQSPVVLARRYGKLSKDNRARVLGITWAAALHEDPSLSRQTLLRARFEHTAADLDSDGREARMLVSGWMSEILATTAKGLSAPATEGT
jgi:DnaJ-domain-containing protein 1